jgi:hypothetical protein
MGYGTWSNQSYANYSTSVGRTVTSINGINYVDGDYSAQELYRSRQLDPVLDPKNVVRECCDSEEHPNTIPVILALDVTGSMGNTAVEVAKKLNEIMTNLYEEVSDVQFMIMGIGDLYCDAAPIQASQFESDIRIAEQLDKIYFEGGGGGNGYESYTAAWYFGLHNTKLDCYDKRGQRGLIITIGDEPLNPYLPAGPLSEALGITVQGDVDTEDLYEEAKEKFDIWHISFQDNRTSFEYYNRIGKLDSWEKCLGDHYVIATAETLHKVISDIITQSFNDSYVATSDIGITVNDDGLIDW